MDPEQIYQEVLQEEQQKGSAAPVAEGRAKSARQRAVHGSPHPKEPKWWPGAQPQFEGDGAAPAAEEEPAVEQPAEEPAAEEPAPAEPAAAEPEPAPAAPAPAAQPAAQPAAAPEPAAAPAAAAPPAQAPAAAAAPAATAERAQTQTPGVMHGTPSGNRLRPEDSVTSEAQFDGERAMRERRRVIDELVSTGVPAVTAQQTAGGTSPLLLLLYILIPILAIGFLVSQEDELAPAAGEEAPAEPGGEGGGEGEGGGAIEVTASGTAFDTDTLTLAAEGETTVHFVNEDSVPHNISVYEDDSTSNAIFEGEIITADEIDYSIPGSGQPGEAYFHCDVHPSMNGTVIFE